MKILVMGAGALGGYFGARLFEAGHEVGFVARGAHLEAIRKNGLSVRSPRGDMHVTNAWVSDQPEDFGQADVVLFMVKNRDVEDAARAILPVLKADSFVVTCQNGVSAPERLGQIIGSAHVLPGVARTPGFVAEPGVIQHTADTDLFGFGELQGGPSLRGALLRDAFVAAGVQASVTSNMRADLWRKMATQATLASMTALTRLDIGPLLETPETEALFLAAVRETEHVAIAEVPEMQPGFAEHGLNILRGFSRYMHASMLDDLEAGKPIEVDYLSGDVVRFGRKHGIDTPLHAMFTAALWPYRDGRPDTTYG